MVRGAKMSVTFYCKQYPLHTFALNNETTWDCVMGMQAVHCLFDSTLQWRLSAKQNKG